MTDSAALGSAVRFLGCYPQARAWLSDDDRSHQKIISAWLDSPVMGSTASKPGHIGRLLAQAAKCLMAQQAALSERYSHVTTSPVWNDLPKSARAVYLVLMAVSRQQGPSVLMCNRALKDLVHVLYPELVRGDFKVRPVRERLCSSRLLTAAVGQAWEESPHGKATVWHLLPFTRPITPMLGKSIGVIDPDLRPYLGEQAERMYQGVILAQRSAREQWKLS